MKKSILASAILLAFSFSAVAEVEIERENLSVDTQGNQVIGTELTEKITVKGNANNSAIQIVGNGDGSGSRTELELHAKKVVIQSEADRVINLKGYSYLYTGAHRVDDADPESVEGTSLTIEGNKGAYAIWAGEGVGEGTDGPYLEMGLNSLDVTGAIHLENGAGMDMGWSDVNKSIENGWIESEFKDLGDSYREKISVINASDEIATLKLDRGMVLMAANNVTIANEKSGNAIEVIGGTYQSQVAEEDEGSSAETAKTFVSIAAKDKLNITGDIYIDAGDVNESIAYVDIHSDGVITIKGDITVKGTKQSTGAINIELSGANSVLEGSVNTITETSGARVSLFTAEDALPAIGGQAYLKLKDNAVWKATGTSNITTLSSDNGSVQVAANASVSMDELSGAGLAVQVGLDEDYKTNSTFKVARETDTKISAKLDATSDDVTVEEGKALKDQIFGDSLVSTMSVEEGYNSNSWFVDENGNAQEISNTLQESTMDLAAATMISLDRILTNDLRKRMGDLRANGAENGVWARYDGGRLSGKNAYENDFNTIQVGADTNALLSNVRTGVAFSYTKGDADYARGTAEMDAYSISAYGTWFSDSGVFTDVIGRIAKADSEMKVDGMKGDLDNMVYSLSGEVGIRMNLASTFYVEPSVELTYAYIDSDKMTLRGVESYKYDIDATNSLVARAGLAAGLKCPSNKGDIYARVNAAHQFLGDTKLTTVTQSMEVDGKDTWVEFGLGGQWNINNATYVWADVERTSGAEVDEDWRATVGVRYNF